MTTRGRTTPKSTDGSYAPGSTANGADAADRYTNENEPLSSQRVLDKYPELVAVRDAIGRKGGTGYLVGGVVRDMASGKNDFSDLDITSKLTPEQFRAAMRELERQKGWTVHDIGEAHGTTGVTIRRPDGTLVEIEHTTFRTETYETDGSREPTVAFGRSLKEDLRRRDFTVNAMALPLDPSEPVYDPFNGQRDLDRNRLRCPSDPRETFREDPLRMLRALRFAARDGIDLDPATLSAVKREAERLRTVSPERVRSELVKLAAVGPEASAAAVVLSRSLNLDGPVYGPMGYGLDANIPTQLLGNSRWEPVTDLDREPPVEGKGKEPHPVPKPYQEALGVLAATAASKDGPLTIDQTLALMKDRKWSKSDIRWAALTFAAMETADRLTGKKGDRGKWEDTTEMRRAIRKHGAAMLLHGVHLAAIRAYKDGHATQNTVGTMMVPVRIRELAVHNGGPLEVAPLPVKGGDAARAGFRGPEIADALTRAEEAFAKNPYLTHDEAMLAIGAPEPSTSNG